MEETRLALLSVGDERGLVPLATGLVRLGYVLVAPARTKELLDQAGLAVVPIEQLTGVPAILGGQVETLHPAVHGGIVARRDHPQDLKTLRDFGVAPVDVVVANFAPPTPAGPPAIHDAGRVALVRAAALNHRDVWVLIDPLDYESALALIARGIPALEARKSLASKAFRHIAALDLALAQALAAPGQALPDAQPPPGGPAQSQQPIQTQPPEHAQPPAQPAGDLHLALDHELPLAGPNADQAKAALWRDLSGEWLRPVPYRQLHGPALTSSAVIDADAAWRAVLDLPERQFSAVVANCGQPCGAAAMQMSMAAAVLRAHDADPGAAAGATLAVNRAVDLGAARALASRPWQTVLAPEFEDEALDFLKSLPELRLISMGRAADGGGQVLRHLQVSSLGVLVRQAEPPSDGAAALAPLASATRIAVQESHRAAMALAWQLVRHSKSAAVVLTDDQGTVGIGAGQVSQADAAQIAAGKSRKGYKAIAAAFGAPLVSAEALTALVRAGVKVVVQPGGAPTDGEIIAAANAAGLAMVLTGQQR
jgi:phosphoribosylaminoimidazolecarboxamide formyltransferase/IMP cyclohydrolase